VERAFGRADELCRALGDSEALFPVLFGHWAFRMARADAQAELETAERLQALAQVSDKDDLILEAHLALGITLYWRGAHARARVHLERVLALYDPDRHGGHAFVYGQDPAAYAATVLQELLWITGAPDRARRMEKRALAAAQRTAHPFTTAGILGGFLVASAAHRGDFAGSLDRAARARSICDEQGFPMVLGLCTFFEGYALLRSGRTREGLQGLRDGLAAVQATGSLVARTNHLCQLADACRRVGETARGLAALGEAVRFTEEHHERYWEPEIHRLRGELLLQEGGDAETPEQCFQHALGIAREMEAKSFELRAATSLARLWQQQSKHVEAHALLAPVYDWFTEGYDTQDLKDAKALLEELGS
jgi:predicted ATPase